jgi:uncharacterized protein YjbI with pentapeptide repeats
MAQLHGTNLTEADLGEADLTRADFAMANLTKANFFGANLREAMSLGQGQVDVAVGDSRTTLPEDLSRPDSWPRHWLG